MAVGIGKFLRGEAPKIGLVIEALVLVALDLLREHIIVSVKL
jgi:hypothetical protein